MSTRLSTIDDVQQLESLLSEPTDVVVRTLQQVEGDLMVLGVAGKMGPTLARMARRADPGRRIIGVSRFSDPAVEDQLRAHGIETIKGDLLEPSFLESLPDAPNVITMAGLKFGTTGRESLAWAMNTVLPSLVCRRFRSSRMVAFSTGAIYAMVPIDSGGSLETDPPAPIGEYAMSCLGRERIFEHFSRTLNIPMAIIRLNYACEMRYGVLLDLARQVREQSLIDLSMGYFNVIWQADANAAALSALVGVSTPPLILNVTGSERLSVRSCAEAMGKILDKPAHFGASESADALLSNASKCHDLYGLPRVGTDRLIECVAHWVRDGKSVWDKATHFQVRDGKF